MGKLSRTKGHGYEREIAARFRLVGFPDARRHLEYHARDANGCDLQGTGVYRVQCKRGRQYAPIGRIKEVQCLRELGEIPVLITRGDCCEDMAVLPLSDFFDLIRRK